MTEMPEPLRADHPKIEIFSDDDALIDEATRALRVISTHDLVVSPTRDFLYKQARDYAVALIVLDIDDGSFLNDPKVHEARRRVEPSTPLVIVSRDVAAERLREVIRLAAADSVHKPLNRQDFVDAVSKCLKQNRASARVTAFVSAAAGSGATTLAMNAAYLVATKPKRSRGPHECMLFELDFSAGAAGNYLDIANDYDFRDVLDNPARIDAELVDIIRKEHPAGFSLLSMRAPILLSNPAGTEIVLRILDVLNFQYRTVIVDIPYYATGWRSTVLETVNDVVLVTESTIPGIKQARAVEKELLTMRQPSSFVIAANRHRRGLLHNSISKKEIVRVFEGHDVETLPDASELIEEAANQGKIPLEANSKSSYSRAVAKFLNRFL